MKSLRKYIEIKTISLAPQYRDAAETEVIRLELDPTAPRPFDVRLYSVSMYNRKSEEMVGVEPLLIECSTRKAVDFNTEYDMNCSIRAKVKAVGGISQLSREELWKSIYESRLETAVRKAFECGTENSRDKFELNHPNFPSLVKYSIDTARSYSKILGRPFSEKAARQLLHHKMQAYYQRRYELALDSVAHSIVHYKGKWARLHLRRAASWGKKAGIHKIKHQDLEESVTRCRQQQQTSKEELRAWVREQQEKVARKPQQQ